MFKEGERIKLLEMPADPAPLPIGATGTITGVIETGRYTHYSVKWDAPNQNRSLCVVVPPDRIVHE